MQYNNRIAIILIGVLYSGLANSLPPLNSENVIFAENPPMPVADADVNYRLPNDTLPEKYTVELTTNIHTGDRKFSGKVQIDLRIVADTSEITVHARQLSGFVATIIQTDVANAQPITLTYSYVQEPEFLIFSAAGKIFFRSSKWRLTISYKGTLRADNKGFYISSYNDENNNVRYLATTQFESTEARHAFPCYDEPAKRADFEIIINHDPSYFALSNMPSTANSTSGRTVFETCTSIPTYLVAFIVSDFKYTEGVLNNLPQRVYSRAGTEKEQEFALVSGLLMIQRLTEYYGIQFPLPKLDMVAMPDFAAGAMENMGLTTYREEYLLYNPDTSTVSTQNNVASTIAHEYTHQWFGDLVTLKWWSYLWLKEGFATLFEYEATDAMFFASHFIRALRNDATPTSRPMTYYVEKPSQISLLYDRIAYSKGGRVLYMWQQALTDKVFRQGLHNYLEANKNGAGEEEDLFRAIQIAAGEKNFAVPARISDMMGSWTRQNNYPLLTVERNYENRTFIISQQAFYNNESIHSDKTWYIPINFAMQSNPDFRDMSASHYFLKTKQIVVEDANIPKDDWLILNKQASGLYRINYDTHNWNLIIDGLLEEPYKIHTLNRAQLIYDAYRFSVSNRLEHSIFLNLLTYLPKEDQYAPLYTAYSVISVFNQYLRADPKYEDFQTYAAGLINSTFDKFGVNDVHGQAHLDANVRNTAINWACMAGIPSCLQQTTNKLINSIDKNIPIEPNLRLAIYCNGLKNTEDRIFNAVYDLLMTSNDQAFRTTLISSLGCSQSPSQIKKFIESSIDKSNKLRTQERTTLLSSAYSKSNVGLEQSIEFLQKNWDAYSKLEGDFDGSDPGQSALNELTSYVTQTEQANKVYALIDQVGNKLPSSQKQSIKAGIEENLNWIKVNRDPIVNWIDTYVNGETPSANSGAVGASLTAAIVLLLAFLF